MSGPELFPFPRAPLRYLGLATFAARFGPARLLLAGGNGIAAGEFLGRPVEE